MGNSTILKEEQVWDNEQHAYLKEKGTYCHPNDLCIILGGLNYDLYDSPIGTSAWWLTTSGSSGAGAVRCVFRKVLAFGLFSNSRSSVVRPALLPSSKITSSPRTGVRGKGWHEITYGEYPTNVVNNSTSKTLERDLKGLIKTGKKYTFDTHKWNEYNETYSPKSYDEYEQNGKRYVRIECYAFTKDENTKLSDGLSRKNGDVVWLEVEPIKLAVDEKTGIALSINGLYSGIQMIDKGGNYNGDFSKTRQKKYLEEVFDKEIEPSRKQERRSSITI